jgi:hypothetical protein
VSPELGTRGSDVVRHSLELTSLGAPVQTFLDMIIPAEKTPLAFSAISEAGKQSRLKLAFKFGEFSLLDLASLRHACVG